MIIYGMGVFGRWCWFDLCGIQATILPAVTQAGNRQQFHGVKVHNLNSLLSYKKEALVIVAVSEKYRSEMADYAKGPGFQNVYTPEIKLNDVDAVKDNPDIDLKAEIMNWYEVHTGKSIDLDCPKTFNEKIQWLKVYESTPEKGELSDKYKVRDYVRDKIGEQYLVPLYGVWNSFDEIDFDRLTERFVLKCTHASGTNEIICSKDENVRHSSGYGRRQLRKRVSKSFGNTFMSPK